MNCWVVAILRENNAVEFKELKPNTQMACKEVYFFTKLIISFHLLKSPCTLSVKMTYSTFIENEYQLVC